VGDADQARLVGEKHRIAAVVGWVMQTQGDRLAGVGLALRWSFIHEVAMDGAPPPVSFFEVSPENYAGRGGDVVDDFERIAARYPILTHGLSLDIGSTDPLDRAYLTRMRGFCRELGVASHSDHLCWNGSSGRFLHDLLPLPATRAAVTHVADRVHRVQDHLGIPLALENISYYSLPGQDMPEQAFVAEVLEAADCRFLLDVNNVWVNARNHGFDPYEYMRALPLHRVDRLHVAGGEWSRSHDLVIDTHGTSVDQDVRAMMVWVLERVGPIPVIYERDHAIPPLAELGREVAELRALYDDAISRARTALVAATAPPAALLELVSNATARRELGRIHDGVAHVVLRHEPMGGGSRPTRSSSSIRPGPHGGLGEVAPKGLRVYRALVRATLENTATAALPVTAAHRGQAVFREDLAGWLAEGGPRSRYLREVPLEFVAWVVAVWRGRADLPQWLPELAMHEGIEWALDSLPSPPRAANPDAPLSLQAVVEVTPACRLITHRARVHELVASEPPQVPVATPVRLLGYRDEDHEVRWMELTPIAYEVVSRLQAGETLDVSITRGAAAAGDAVTDEILGRIATVLADLAKRGVLLGARPALASAHAAVAQPSPPR
jgi:uncharacterized protein (UPF0276 family)